MSAKSHSEEISFSMEEIAAERNRLLLHKNRSHSIGRVGTILAVLLLGLVFGWHLPGWMSQTDETTEQITSASVSSSEEGNSADEGSGEDSQVSQTIPETEVSSGSEDDTSDEKENSDLSSADEDENIETLTGTVDVKTYLNVRSGGGLDCDIIGALLPGAKVTVIEEKNGWYRVEISEVVGYVYGEYLEVEDF